MGDQQNKNQLTSFCVGCGLQILDRFLLRVSPDLEWHARCLRCARCGRALEESGSCFIRDGKTFCKEHRERLCTNKCAKCHKVFISQEYVMRTRVNVYHVQCFRCEGCDRLLLPGDEYMLRDGQMLCTDHQNKLMTTSDNQQKEDDNTSKRLRSLSWSSLQRRSDRTARVRTVLSEAQLQMLQTCYSTNPRPDALLKEQLVEMTGLSPRVIRVWFQNKRCKDKKKGLTTRHTHKQIPDCPVSEDLLLPVSSESRDTDVMISPPWKLLTDFILQNHAELRSYQQLLSLSKEGLCSAGSEVVSTSDTHNSLTARPTDVSQ